MNNYIYGFHSISALIEKNPKQIMLVYLSNKSINKRHQDLIATLNRHDIAIKYVENSMLDKLAQTNKHQGAIAELNMTIDKKITLEYLIANIDDKPNAIILILDGVTDPQNLGAIIRSADCFGIAAVILPKNNSANCNSQIVAKTSSGAINHIPVIVVNNLTRAIEKLKNAQFWVVGTTLHDKAVSLFEFAHISDRIVWVMGSEGDGLRRLISENCDYLVTIPLTGHTQSLNVSVATGIVLAHTRYKQQLK